MQLEWKCKHFDELTAKELYKILRLRSEVFVVEQNCVYLDIDNKDLESYHLAGYDGKDLVAYARLLAPGVAFKEASIGRVATHPTFRKTGAGKQLLMQAIDACLRLFPSKEIKIGAQLYLEKFYTDFGFTQSSELYLEDGISHIEMILRK